MKLKNKKAVITGGSRGIGRAIAERLAEDGADVAITYVSNAGAAAAVVSAIEAYGRRGLAIRADAGDADRQALALREAADYLDGLDILVHNAGVAKVPPTASDTLDNFRHQFAVNVEGIFAGTLEVLPRLRDGGRIILVGSVGAHRMPFPGGAVYGATKAALMGLARGWARDLAPRGILVNVVNPGPTDTDLSPADGPFASILNQHTALGRFGRPEEIAAAVAFLASEDASFITGTALDVDGGFSI